MRINHNEICTFDVVLTRSSAIAANLTTKISDGQFSHASFVLEPHLWFDAQPQGCGYYPALKLVDHSDPEFLNLSSFSQAALLRHPLIAMLSASRREELKSVAESNCRRFNGRRYVNYEDLLPLVQHPTLKRIVSRSSFLVALLASGLDQLHKGVLDAETDDGTRAPSHFCSELVIHIFEQLGLDANRFGLATSFRPDDLRDPARSWLRSAGVQPAGQPEGIDGWGLLNDDITAALQSADDMFDSLRTLSSERVKRELSSEVVGEDLSHWQARALVGIDALVEDSQRYHHMIRNLLDFKNQILSESLNATQKSFLQGWCRSVWARLQEEAPLRPLSRSLFDFSLEALAEHEQGDRRASVAQRREDCQRGLDSVNQLHGYCQTALIQTVAALVQAG